MDTLAYLHLAEDYENSGTRELNLTGLKNVAVAGAIGAACVVGGIVGTADSASACGYYGGGGCGGGYYGYGGGYYGGGHYGGGYYSHRPYYPRYYSYQNYHRPCY